MPLRADAKVFKVVHIHKMSALKSDFKGLFLNAVSKLESPWRDILPVLDEMDVQTLMRNIGQHSLDVAGVTVKNHACTFEKIAQRVENTDVSHFLLVLYGLVMTSATGDIHTHVKQYMRTEWIPWVLSARVNEEPVFYGACRRSLRLWVEWMTALMEDVSFWAPLQQRGSNGDTALHLAVRHRQWEWSAWLVKHGVSPTTKNNSGDTALSLAMPYHQCLSYLQVQTRNSDWFNALHHALVAGRTDATWCVALLDMGADVNQVELYDAPVDSLAVFAKHGMDMNLGPLPASITVESLQLMYAHGHVPRDWKQVLYAVSEDSWMRTLYSVHVEKSTDVPETLISNVIACQAVTPETQALQRRFIRLQSAGAQCQEDIVE